jgi:competence protein ComEC
MYVDRASDVVVLDRSRGPLLDVIVAARTHVRKQIARHVATSDAQAVLSALLLGNRSRIDDHQREQFAETGLMHLLAVSGLHVFLVGMVLYALLRPLLMRFRLRWRSVEGARALLTMAVLSLYMLLTGARPSVVRAVVMSGLLIGGVLFQRSAHPLNTLGVAALVLLALRPPALFDAGFQLSMAAVAGIVSINPRLVDWVPEDWMESGVGEWLVSTVTVSAAATVGTAPVLLSHFGWVSAAGLLLNVLGIPLTGLALSAAAGMVLVGEVWSVAGAALGTVADLSARGLLLVSSYGADWMGEMGIRVPEPGIWILGAIAAGAIALAQWPRPRHRWRCLLLALLLATVNVWGSTLGPEGRPTLDVLFFDVGQGDAILITTPAERRVLVDTGPRYGPGRAALSSAVLPYLEQRGIHHLETVVISHPDEDHLGGLPALLREMSVGRVLHSGQESDTDLFRESRRLLNRRSVPATSVRRGEHYSLGRHVRMRVLGPPTRPARRGIESENGCSVVVRLVYGRVSVLLPGDVEKAAERDLVRTYGHQLAGQVVKVPHHGSETSSTPAFVRAATSGEVSPFAVVSVGRPNRFGMPSPKVLSRWKSEGARVRSTARRGAVWLRADGESVWRVSWK